MRGQVQQVFIYILVIIVVGLIMLMGYRAISDFTSQGENIKLVNLQTDLENFAERHTSYGVIKNEKLTAPSGISKICFLNNSMTGDVLNIIIKQYVSTTIEQINVFLIGEETIPFLKLDLIQPLNHELECITAQSGKFHIKFEGKGSKVLVSGQ
jgi:hypothetical protein